MGCNILAVRPGVVVMVDGAPKVRKALEQHGVEVHTYDGTRALAQGRRRPDLPHRAAAARLAPELRERRSRAARSGWLELGARTAASRAVVRICSTYAVHGRTAREVDLEAGAHLGRQRALEVVGDELDDLAAADPAGHDREAHAVLAVEVVLELGADLRARAVQQHALVAVAEVERGRDLLGLPALDVAQRR